MSAAPRLNAGTLEGRPFRRDDWPVILALHRAPEASRWLLPPGEEASEGRARRVADVFAEAWLAEGFGPYLWSRSGRPVGYGGLRRRAGGAAGEIEALFAFEPESWGRGWASAVGRAALESDGPRPGEGGSVIGRVRPGNAAAQALLLRLGFAPEGEALWRGLALETYRWRPGATAAKAHSGAAGRGA